MGWYIIERHKKEESILMTRQNDRNRGRIASFFCVGTHITEHGKSRHPILKYKRTLE